MSARVCVRVCVSVRECVSVCENMRDSKRERESERERLREFKPPHFPKFINTSKSKQIPRHPRQTLFQIKTEIILVGGEVTALLR